MRPSWRILLLASAVSAGLPATAEGPAPPSAKADVQLDGSDRLDSFVREAIDEGLLTPSGQQVETEAPDPVAEAEAEPRRVVSADTTCPAAQVYDFARYSTLKTYDDLLAWRKQAKTESLENPEASLAGAYLALGMNEEARLQLQGKAGAEATALRQLAGLMEGRGAPDLRHFHQVAACEGLSDFWLAVALLETAPEEAAERLKLNINAFRALPQQMRIEVAARVVPVLETSGNAAFAEKLMAMFTTTEIAGSKRLGFNEALLGLSAGGASAEQAMRAYLRQPEFREAAVQSLLSHGAKVDRRFQSDVADRLVDRMKTDDAPQNVAGNLDTMLNDLQGVADYDTTLQMAGLPATQSPEARDQLARHFITLVETDLQSKALMDNLRAMDALMRGDYLVEGRPEGDAAFSKAAALAVDLGFRNLAETFATRSSDTEELALARASLAYRTLDHAALKSLLGANRRMPGIIRLAALSAVREGDELLLSMLADEVRQDPEASLDVIEMDASSGRWIVSDAVYQAAARLEGEENRKRYERVRELRAGVRTPGSIQSYEMADIDAALARSRRILNPQSQEMR
ncbi:hypothetical protein [Henriciella sp.]|uniref:hypothetical protein n=1 Tax=Henriciella sp. TaxID=1968823 RepID=UPI00261397B8|nr:hypothetical protein [Henriciella sp.]